MQCSNKLKQIGLALHNYHDTYEAMPALYSDSTKSGPPYKSQPNRIGIRIRILPFIEQLPLYQACEETTADVWQKEVNGEKTPFADTVDSYVCPSDGSSFVSPCDNGNPTGASNYGFMLGDRPYCSNNFNARGVFEPSRTRHHSYGFSAITDGLSNTMGLSEAIRPQTTTSWGNAPVYNPFYRPSDIMPLFNTTTKEYTQAVTFLPKEAPVGYRWSEGAIQWSGLTAAMPPNHASLRNNAAGMTGGTYCIVTPSSAHTNGVNICLMDGSVRFASETIHFGTPTSDYPPHPTATNIASELPSPFGVWGALSTKDRGETESF